jgi:hypothetical protein
LFLEVAAKVDGYPDYASFCRDLQQAEKGRSYRDLAGLDQAIPGQDSFSNFRKRVSYWVVKQTMDVMVQLLQSPPIDPLRQWGIKPTGFFRVTLPLGRPHFSA